MEEFELLGDPKYRSYMTQVDRCLKGFEQTTEWADLIAALTKLNKVLSGHMKFPIIPRRIVISKRLAQCMHPALPAGVHQKALETYDIIFKCMGTNRLAAELFIYSAGLFPLLSNAAMNVRSILLSVYETHFVPLGERLRPGLNGFLSGVLPGLEEGSDHYQRTNLLLEAVAEAVQPQVFYSGLWECVATNATIRLPALTFVLAHCGKRTRGVSAVESAPYLLGADHDVMCRALCLALQDSSALVQRSALDLLLQGFPIHRPQFVKQDMVCLVQSVLTSLLRRDMSLNRRLFSWLLGSEISPIHLPGSAQKKGGEDGGQLNYFSEYSKELIVPAVLRILEESLPVSGSKDPIQTKPYRIITTLLDKPEIGPLIIHDIIIDIFRTLYHMSKLTGLSGNQQDLIKTANLLFSQLDTSFVWTVCATHFQLAACATAERDGAAPLTDRTGVLPVGDGPTNIQEICTLLDFLLEIVSIETYVETSSQHLPNLFKSMVKSIKDNLRSVEGVELRDCLTSCKRVLGRVQPAWNVWDISDTFKKKDERPDVSEIGREATESNPTTPDKPALNTASRARGSSLRVHDELIQSCNRVYTDMFHHLLEQRYVLTPGNAWPALLQSSRRNGKNMGEGERNLGSILEGMMEGLEVVDGREEGTMKGHHAVLLHKDIQRLAEAFSSACSGLIELSSMPKYGKSEGSPPPGLSTGPDLLPPWLQALLLVATLPPTNSTPDIARVQLQLTAVTTLVDLAGVLNTSLAAGQRRTTSSGSGVETVVVTMDPLLTAHHLAIISQHTDTIRRVADSLWKNLETIPPAYHIQCVSLLHRLLELAPSPSLVETVVAESLHAAASSVNVYKRFAQLWHLSRDMTGSKKTLDLCILKMVSGLRSDKSGVRTLCERWVEHSLSRGDSGRLLEPLLLALLDPSSARLSVLHANIKESSTSPSASASSSPRLSRVFAISSVDNNIIYHVSNSKPAAGGRHKVQSVTGLDGRTSVTDMSLLNPEFLTKFPYAKMSMFVNPFALVSSESEFNQDPSGTPDPDEEIDDEEEEQDAPLSSPTVSGSNSLSSSHQSTPATPRRSRPSVEKVEQAQDIVASLLEDILDKVISEDSFLLQLDDLKFPEANHQGSSGSNCEDNVTVHPLHSHLLLYCRCIDSRAVLHTIQALSSIVTIHPRLAVSCLATTGVASPSLSRSVQLVQLLARHKRSIFGKGFSSKLLSESTSHYRSSMLLEVVLTVCLYYLRSFYPAIPGLTREEVLGNREVQLAAVSLLNKIASELILVVKDNGKPFALFICDLFNKTKLQKVILHSLLAGVHSVPVSQISFTIDILRYNDEEIEPAMSVNTEAFQVEILKLVLSLVMLEEIIFQKKYEDVERPRLPYVESTVMKYNPDHPFSEQPMFLAAVLSALRQQHLRDLHHHWTNLVISCLPFLGTALTQVVSSVSAQIWSNLEDLASLSTKSNDNNQTSVPSDYVLTQLEALGQILSYCLLEAGQQGGVASGPTPILLPAHQQPTSLVHNLIHVFGGPSHLSRQPASQEQLLSARRSLLSLTPRLMVALSALWRAVTASGDSRSARSWLVGSSKAVRNMILELLSPISTVHPTYFLAGVAVAWAEQGGGESGRKVLVELVSSLRMFPTSTLIATLRQVLKSPPPVSGSIPVSLEASSLQFLSLYLSSTSNLAESWNSLKDLLKDCLGLSPPSLFLALQILHQAVIKGVPSSLEKRDVRDLQEIACKQIEAVAVIGGCRLEAGTWLRGSRSLRTDIQIGREVDYAVEALNILGDLMATILDIIFQSEEKEKVIPLMTTVMYNTVPYLRAHTKGSMMLLRGASQVLASVSEYPYTRKAWRREGMELLLDPAFFQMDHDSLRFWKTTTDNLMTHDKTTFKELLSRIASLGQSNISLFSSKEQEQEQRALLLKRLAFVIFCSDVDQYQKQMPDITDRLSDCLRTVPVSPAVQAAVFLCFRVILLRMSAVHVTFLWPVIITEMVLVFSYIEQELSSDSQQFSNHLKRVSTLDSTWVAAAANAAGPGLGLGLQAHNSPAWLSVYLAVSKLLDQAVALPASLLPQFQMYRWAFVREGSCAEEVENGHGPGVSPFQVQDFVPHIARIARLLEAKLGREIPPRPIIAGEPLLTMKYIESLTELGPWFSTLSYSLTRQQTKSFHASQTRQRSPIGIIEKIIELDFLEPIH